MSNLNGSDTIRKSHGLDKHSFLIIFFLGAVGIFISKTLIFENVILQDIKNIQLYVLIWPISLMVLYLWMVTKAEPFRLLPDQAGDNMYYLGFLFTLTSLAVALFHFTLDADASLGYIISSFGIALFTTILGVALRVVLHQMRIDPFDIEQEAHFRIAESASQLRSQLDSSVVDFNSFRRQMNQSLEESFLEMREITGRFLKESNDQVNKNATTAAKGINDAFIATNDNAKKLNQSAKRTFTAIEKLIDNIESIDVPQNLIERRFADATEPLVQLVKKISAQDRIDENTISKLNKSVEALLQASNDMYSNTLVISEYTSKTQELFEKFDSLLPHFKQIESAVVASADSFGKVSDHMNTFYEIEIGIVKKQGEALDDILEEVSSQHEVFFERLNNQTQDAAQHTLEAIKSLAERQNEIYESFSNQAKETLDSMKTSRQLTENEVAKARDATHEVMHQLASMVRTLSEQLSSK